MMKQAGFAKQKEKEICAGEVDRRGSDGAESLKTPCEMMVLDKPGGMHAKRHVGEWRQDQASNVPNPRRTRGNICDSIGRALDWLPYESQTLGQHSRSTSSTQR
jgi:hypothetical protein